MPVVDLEQILIDVGPGFEALRRSRLFITGGTGFFGTWLIESLAFANDRCGLNARAVVLTRDPAAVSRRLPHLAARSDVVFHAGDLTTFEFPRGNFDFLIHAANNLDPAQAAESPEAALSAVVRGNDRVMNFAAQAGVRKLLLTSSGAVYGPQPPELERLPEDFVPTAELPQRAFYARGKRLIETSAQAHALRLGYELKVARCFAFIGPHLPLNAEFAAGNFLRDALRGGPITIAGDGTPIRSYLYAADLAAWLWRILFFGIAGRPYNVGSPEPISIAALARKIGAAVLPACAVVLPQPPADRGLPSRYVPAVDRAREELNLSPRTTLELAIAKTVQWHRQSFT